MDSILNFSDVFWRKIREHLNIQVIYPTKSKKHIKLYEIAEEDLLILREDALKWYFFLDAGRKTTSRLSKTLKWMATRQPTATRSTSASTTRPYISKARKSKSSTSRSSDFKAYRHYSFHTIN